MIIYEDIYKEIDFLCKVCIKSYCYGKCREMLGIRRIVSIKKYKFIDKVFCDKCELNEWKYIVTFIDGGKHFLCNRCSRFFINMKYKEMAGIKDIKKIGYDLRLELV